MNSEIFWLNCSKDKFLVSGEELKIYEVNDNFEERYKLIKTDGKYNNVRCTALFTENDETTVACGLINGKVSIVRFTGGENVNSFELPSTSTRSVQCMAWRGNGPQIAVGYDKSKTENCIALWDVHRDPIGVVGTYGGIDSVYSLCWDTELKYLIAGTSNKQLKVFDVRKPEKEIFCQATKCVQGVQCGPNGVYVSSYNENFISLYDLRSFDKPIHQINTQKTIVQTFWCPTRICTLGVIHSDQYIHLYDVLESTREIETSIPFRSYTPFGSDMSKNIALSSFSFHFKDFERVLVLSTSGLINDYTVPQRNVIAFDKNSNHIWSTSIGNDMIAIDLSTQASLELEKNNGVGIENIAQLMRDRALKDYGQIADVQQNGELAGDEQLDCVWKLLAHMYHKGCMLGLKSILGVSQDGATISKSDSEYVDWCDYPSFKPIKMYISEQRKTSQSLCGWNIDRTNDISLNLFLNGLCEDKQFLKAAAIACFHLKLKLAVDILTKSIDDDDDIDVSVLRIAAIAISNYHPDKHLNSSAIHNQIKDPYLKAIFSFLNADTNFDEILTDQKLPLADRMAFACIYLSDNRLAEYIRHEMKKCIDYGDLNGILLTGVTSDGMTLLQNYLDSSEDIQSVALISSRFFTDQLGNFKIQHWIATYRDLLDMWGFFNQRANFDIMLSSKSIPPKSIYLLCNFCGKSVSSAIQEDNRIRPPVNKISSCPHCRKPLPRCSLCMLHLGTSSTDVNDQISRQSNVTFQAKPFSNWFAWCQTCRHGGHMKHLNAWFSQYSECPVTSCQCNCYKIDQPKFSKCN